ncbi:MAG: hypothetical protein R3B90_13110 [Planctomycetaceae bacterium]
MTAPAMASVPRTRASGGPALGATPRPPAAAEQPDLADLTARLDKAVAERREQQRPTNAEEQPRNGVLWGVLGLLFGAIGTIVSLRRNRRTIASPQVTSIRAHVESEPAEERSKAA